MGQIMITIRQEMDTISELNSLRSMFSNPHANTLCKHAIMCQNWARTVLNAPELDRNSPDAPELSQNRHIQNLARTVLMPQNCARTVLMPQNWARTSMMLQNLAIISQTLVPGGMGPVLVQYWHFNINMASYPTQYGKPHCWDKMVITISFPSQ